MDKKVAEVGQQSCFISERKVAELKYGVENSKTMEDMRVIIEVFIPPFSIIPIYNSLDIYAKEKAKLRKQCLLIDDFNILIGATAITHDMVLKTNNVAHLSRIDNIIIEDSTKQSKYSFSGQHKYRQYWGFGAIGSILFFYFGTFRRIAIKLVVLIS